jgi:hypothetical protein
MTPEEALKPAVERACKALNTLETVYWVDRRTIKSTDVKSLLGKDKLWEAWAEGTAKIGKTITQTGGKFHVPKEHTFKIHYKLAKDEWGIPDIAIIDIPELIPVEKNPAKLIGPLTPAPMAKAQAEAIERGKEAAKAAKAERARKAQEKPQEKTQ